MSYQHKVEKKEIPTCNIMGVDIAAINMEWLLKFTKKNIYKLSGDYMCVSNVYTTVTASEDAAYCMIQNGGIMAIPDGGPLSYIGRKRGYRCRSFRRKHRGRRQESSDKKGSRRRLCPGALPAMACMWKTQAPQRTKAHRRPTTEFRSQAPLRGGSAQRYRPYS